jgi:hypothetical protein
VNVNGRAANLTAARGEDGDGQVWGVREYTRDSEGKMRLGVWVTPDGWSTGFSSASKFTNEGATAYVLGYEACRRDVQRFLGN